jgi:hypothetical protein
MEAAERSCASPNVTNRSMATCTFIMRIGRQRSGRHCPTSQVWRQLQPAKVVGPAELGADLHGPTRRLKLPLLELGLPF